jgi:hypothetical protein
MASPKIGDLMAGVIGDSNLNIKVKGSLKIGRSSTLLSLVSFAFALLKGLNPKTLPSVVKSILSFCISA